MSPSNGTLVTSLLMVSSKMPPITAVSPLLTMICVTTFRLSIAGATPPPACGTNWATESLEISTVMMIRLSGVICGVTSSFSSAGTNAVLIPFCDTAEYGICWPCWIDAF